MASISLSTISGTSMEEIINAIERQRKEIEYIMMNLDDDNISSVSGDKITSLDAAKITNLTVDMAQIRNLVVDTANIKDAAITTAKIGTAQIGNAQIDRATINKLVVGTADIAVGAIKTALIDTSAIETAQIADLSVTDGKVVSLTANKLTAGVIDAANITVKNLVADNIVTGTLTIASANLFMGTHYDDTANMWKSAGLAMGKTTNLATEFNDTYLKIDQSGTTELFAYLDRQTLKPSQDVTITVWGNSDGTSKGGDIYLLLSDTLDDSEANKRNTGWNSTTSGYTVLVGAFPAGAGWTKFQKTITLPAGVKSGYIRLDHNGSNTSGTTSSVRFSPIMVQYGKLASAYQPHTNELLAAKGIQNFQLDDGSIDNRVITANTITGDRLIIDTITAREIASKTITANEIAANTITAASGIIANAAITTAMIGDAQITSAKIKSITFDQAQGGTLTLGGSGNVNGRFQVLNSAGEVVVDLDAASGGFETLTIGTLSTRSMVSKDTHTADFNRYINTSTGSDDNSGASTTTAYKTISGFLADQPKYLDYTMNVYVAGNSSETVLIKGFEGGGHIRFYFQNTTLTGSISAFGNTCRFSFYDLTINNTSGYGVFGGYYSSYLFLQNVTIYGQNKCPLGIYANDNTFIYAYLCTVYDVTDVAIKAAYMGKVLANGNQGKGGNYGLYAEAGGRIALSAANPGGGAGNYGTASGGAITGTYTADFGSATPPTPPPSPDTVGTWSSTGADSYRSTFWANESTIKQGDYGYGNNRGCWFFGTAPSTAVTGKTITKMRVYLDRLPNTGNWSSNVTVTLRWHGYTSEPAGAPTVQSDTTAVVFSSDQAKWVDLPSTFYADFQAGTAKGIMMYDANGSNYCGFSSSASLEITYH